MVSLKLMTFPSSFTSWAFLQVLNYMYVKVFVNRELFKIGGGIMDTLTSFSAFKNSNTENKTNFIY